MGALGGLSFRLTTMLFASEWQVDSEQATPGSALPSPELFARRAFDLLERGESRRALECAEAGTNRFPEYATGWFMRATSEAQCGAWDESLRSIERCLALEPTFLSAWGLLETILTRQGREAAARAAHQRLEELLGSGAQPAERLDVRTPSPAQQDAPAHSPARNTLVLVKPAGSFETPTLAEVYRRQGLLDRALEVYRRILERHPDDAGALAMVHKLEDELASRRHTAGAA